MRHRGVSRPRGYAGPEASAGVVGDDVWDVKAAKRLQLLAVGLLTGGYAESELTEAGAAAVFAAPGALLADLEDALTRLRVR